MNRTNQNMQTNISCTERQIAAGDLQQRPQSSAPAPVEIANVPERKWSIGCTDSKVREHLRTRFENLAAHAAELALRTKYEHRFQAVDAWLDLLKRETRFGHEWKISLLLTASAEHCGDLRLRALTSERHWDAEIWGEIERQLRTLMAENPRHELYAIDRGDQPSIVGSHDAKDGDNYVDTSMECGV
jgi:hypothetical protein